MSASLPVGEEKKKFRPLFWEGMNRTTMMRTLRAFATLMGSPTWKEQVKGDKKEEHLNEVRALRERLKNEQSTDQEAFLLIEKILGEKTMMTLTYHPKDLNVEEAISHLTKMAQGDIPRSLPETLYLMVLAIARRDMTNANTVFAFGAEYLAKDGTSEALGLLALFSLAFEKESDYGACLYAAINEKGRNLEPLWPHIFAARESILACFVALPEWSKLYLEPALILSDSTFGERQRHVAQGLFESACTVKGLVSYGGIVLNSTEYATIRWFLDKRYQKATPGTIKERCGSLNSLLKEHLPLLPTEKDALRAHIRALQETLPKGGKYQAAQTAMKHLINAHFQEPVTLREKYINSIL